MNVKDEVNALVQEYLADNHYVKVMEFMDELLLIASDLGEISCRMGGDGKLRFQSGQEIWEVEIGRTLCKLRMLCARLGVLCNESGGDVSLYGGEGIIKSTTLSLVAVGSRLGTSRGPESEAGSLGNGELKTWAVRFKNTPDAQEFTIRAL